MPSYQHGSFAGAVVGCFVPGPGLARGSLL